jgi:hypothetical protein
METPVFVAVTGLCGDRKKTVIRGLAKDSLWIHNHENLFVRAPRHREELHRLRPGPESMSRRRLGIYTRAVALFRDLALACAGGSHRNMLRLLNRIDVLVIDDRTMAPLSEPERRSLILTSSCP